MQQGKQQPQHQPAVDPAFWNITRNSKLGEFESGMSQMLFNQALDYHKQNQALKNRIKRLEEAGDALANTQTYDLLETVNWRKSKEAKP
jgi:hypothetical protein